MKNCLFSLFFIGFISSTIAQPTGFVDEFISDNWITPVGLTFDKLGRMYVWEKSGKVYTVINGQKSENPIIDISEEVLDFNDHGLVGFALDPNFLDNGYIYLLYAAKYNYVVNFGTPRYDVALNEGFKKTIGRVTRYTLNDSLSVDYGSRKVLLGESLQTGIPILVDNHGVNSLVFGTDGSLLVSAGDASLTSEPPQDDTQSAWFLEAVEQGLISTTENVNAYRSQLKTSLNGKILRINPETGDGLPSNPFYDAQNPRSPASRIWALGLRNPYRFCIKPKSGSTNLSDGNPGTIVLGDVGWYHREELNVISKGGLNLGWPVYEGLTFENEIFNNSIYKPLVHTLPAVEWRGAFAQSRINNENYVVGSPEFKGKAFSGVASIGGVFDEGTNFPNQYRGLYFFGDYEGWVKAFRFNEKNEVVEVIDFFEGTFPTCFAQNPVDGNIYYTSYDYPDVHEIRKITYDLNANLPPRAIVKADPYFGKSPLTVQFKGTESTDPENKITQYEWDLGDGNTTTAPDATHTYVANESEPTTYAASLTVTDAGGKSSTKTINVFVNNTPPKINSTTLQNISEFDNKTEFKTTLNADVKDEEHKDLRYQWQIVLFHEDHSHFVGNINRLQDELVLPVVPCDKQRYFYRITLKVTDPTGLSSEISQDITPKCADNVVILSNEVSVSPNPTKKQINLYGIDDLDNKNLLVRLFDIHGRLIVEDKGFWKNLKQRIEKEFDNQSIGIYLLNVSFENQNQTLRILKE